jgi:NitT/TauT family transport system permease protein
MPGEPSGDADGDDRDGEPAVPTDEPAAASRARTDGGTVSGAAAAESRRGPLEGVDALPLLRAVAGTTGFLLVWYAAALTQPTYLLPGPVEVAVAFYGELVARAVYTVPLAGTDAALPRLVVKLLQSLQHYLPGLLVGTVLGIALGVAMGWSGRLDEALTPVTRVLRPIPPLAWIAFAIVWIGIGHAGATFIVAIGAFWINFYNAYAGVEGLPRDLREVAASLGVHDDLTMVRKVVLPAASPEILTGIRTSIGQCWMVVVAAELFGAPGIGFQIISASQNLATDVSVVYMLVISLVFLASDWGFRRVERRVLAWRV